MADLTRFLTYYIVLTDPALVAQYQAQFPYGYGYAPATGAAVAFGAPWAGSFPGTDPNHVPSGTYFGPAPYTWSPEWISANNYDATVATFQRHSGGFWGIGGTTVRYYWLGQFVLQEPAAPTIIHVAPPVPAPMPTRRFVEGFELGGVGIFKNNGSGSNYSRDASRHVGGFGLAQRGPSNNQVNVNQDGFGAALSAQTWERFYIRLRQTDPANTVVFWGAQGSVTATSGVHLGITADGRLACFLVAGGPVRTLVATSTQTLPIWNGSSTDSGWRKIDVLLTFAKVSAGFVTGSVQVFINGVSVISLTGITAAGLGTDQFHKSSFMGTTQTPTTLYLDVDDWMAADQPSALTGNDWLLGTKIVAARPKALGANHSVNWVGDLRILLQNQLAPVSTAKTITSSTSGAIAEVDLDIDLCVTRDEGAKGVAAFMIQTICAQSVGLSGQLGYLLNGGAPVMTAINENSGSNDGFAARKSLADGVTAGYPTFTSLTARKTKALDVNAASIVELAAQIELVGVWDASDYRVSENGTAGTPAFPRFVGQHNAPYPRSVFAKGTPAPPPNAPVIVTSGTYVGNGTGLDITFRAPIHFLFIRPTSGDSGGMKWWPTMGASHKSANESPLAMIARVDQDTTFVPGVGVDLQQERYRVRIASNDAQVNAVGITYQYVAFSDPGARFCLCGQMTHLTTQPTYDNNLINPTFTPEAGFFQGEQIFSTSVAPALRFKGLGTTADAVMSFTSTAQLAAALTFGVGKLTTQPNFHALQSGISQAFALFRRHDGNNDPGEPAVLALANWTGDGTASRSVTLAPSSGKRPLFAFVCPSDASGGFFRDPSHLTTHSCGINGADSTTGITGGAIDSLSVGVGLNANGVTYSAFILLGSATAGNGGFSIDGEYIPVEAAPPADGPFPRPTIDQVNPPAPAPAPIVGEPDLEDITLLSDNATEIGGLVGGQTCEYYTRHVVNMSLSRIGVSKRIAILSTEASQEATLARSHVLEDTNQVLRDFPWGFAKRYANLALVAGTSTVPVNADWQYSYRAPAAMMKARRVANQNMIQRRYDPNPPRFEVGADSVGPLIYSNEVATAAVPLVLEYTVRSICPALYGDALFRDSLAWKFAASLAPVLSKDSKKQDYCYAMYARSLSKAETAGAQEQQQAKQGDADWINDREFGPSAQPTMWPWGER